MPAKKVDYVAQPYVREPYRDSGASRSLAALIADRGQTEAAMHLRRGDDQARMWQQAGGVVTGAVNNWLQQVEDRRQRALVEARESRNAEAQGLQMEAARTSLAREKRKDATAQFTRQILPMARRQNGVVGYDRDLLQREYESAGMADALPDVFAALDEQEASHLQLLETRREVVAGDALRVLQGGGDAESYDGLLDFWEANEALPAKELKAMRKFGADPAQRQQALLAAVQSSPKYAQVLKGMREAAAPKLHNVPEGAAVIDERNPQAGPLYVAPKTEKPEEPPSNLEAAILRETDPAKRAELIGLKEQFARAGRAPAQPRASEPLVPIVGDDGRPVLVPRSEAVGRQPASTREQGRQVTSGDAGDIAEFNTALDDVATLTDALRGNQSTGAAAKIGASLPNAVTEFTGWGTEAKQKQAVIDRVRQVIGKALEGGVLRKEDETKYAKILPTIGDTAEVVASKLEGLQSAIQQRQRRKLDALEDAGYDTSRFQQPQRPSSGGGPVQMRAPDGRVLMVPADKVDEAKRRGAKVVG